MPIGGGFVALKLNNGTAIEGVVCRVFCGNNAGNPWLLVVTNYQEAQ